MKEKTIVLSMDAMVSEDLAYLKTKPNFSRLFEKCAQVEKMCTVYPSITYPAHVSMMTGCRPGKHGIFTRILGDSMPEADGCVMEDMLAEGR